MNLDFEVTFAPEIAAFAPPQPVRENMPTPSPSWPRSPPSLAPTTPQHHKSNSSNANNMSAEVSTVQPVSLRQGRGARLSFLGGRKKDAQPGQTQTNGDQSQQLNGDAETASSGSRSLSKDNPNRRSFFRAHSSDDQRLPRNGTNGTDTSAPEWTTESMPRESMDTAITEKHQSGGDLSGVKSIGSVRKRLSMLKLGKKASKGSGLMGSLDEE